MIDEPIAGTHYWWKIPSKGEPGVQEDLREQLADRLEQIAGRLERMHLEEYLRYITDKRRFLRVHFWSGVARGLGTAIGFTVLGAVVVVILQRLLTSNIPLIGDFLAEVARVVKSQS